VMFPSRATVRKTLSWWAVKESIGDRLWTA
jgi:hypothetical protein